MPDPLDLETRAFKGDGKVAVAVRTRKGDDGGFHRGDSLVLDARLIPESLAKGQSLHPVRKGVG